MICPKCSHEITGGTPFCPFCGEPVATAPQPPRPPQQPPVQQQYQQNPYQQNPYRQNPYQPGPNPQASGSEKNKVAAGLFALFLGTLGIHKFYLGNTTAGIIMLIVSVVGSIFFGLGLIAMGVIAFIEGIIYLTKDDADFYNTYVVNKKEWF